MKTGNEFVGRVALDSGLALAGFLVEMRIEDFRATAVSDSTGQFRLPKPKDASHVPSGTRAEIIIRTRNNQVIHRQWCAKDGRFLGITVPRKSLPRSPGHSNRLPRIPKISTVEPRDVGQQGDILLQDVPLDEKPAVGRIAAVGGRMAAAYGSTLLIWTVNAAKRIASSPVKVALKGKVLDLISDSSASAFLLLVDRRGKDTSRDLLAVGAKGNVIHIGSVDGSWQRFALLHGKPVIAFAATLKGDPVWALMTKNNLRKYKLPWSSQDVAFAGKHALVSGGGELRLYDMDGRKLGRTAWPARIPALINAGANAALAFNVGRGRATRFYVDRQNRPAPDDTIRIERRAPIGWWDEHLSLIALLRDVLRWWCLPPLEPEAPPEPPPDEFVFFGRT